MTLLMLITIFELLFKSFCAVCCLSFQVKVEWSTPARPNGDIVSYTVYQRDPVQLSMTSTVFTPEDLDFSDRHTTLHGLAAYHRSVKADQSVHF